MKYIHIYFIGQMSIAAGILVVGAISLFPWCLIAQEPECVSPNTITGVSIAEMRFANKKDTLHWQLALVRNERLKTKKALLDAELDLLSADAAVKSQPNSAELLRKFEKVKSTFEIARQQEANWTNEVTRLEARLKDIGGQAPSAQSVATNIRPERVTRRAASGQMAVRAKETGNQLKVYTPQEVITENLTGKVMVTFRVGKVDAPPHNMPMGGVLLRSGKIVSNCPPITLYPEGAVKENGPQFCVRLYGDASRHIRNVIADSVSHFTGKTVRVTGEVKFDRPVTAKQGDYMVYINSLDDIKVTEPFIDTSR